MAGINPKPGARIGVACSHCLASETAELRMKSCGHCKRVHYCSPECQKKNWPTHKQTCKAQREAMDAMIKINGKEFQKSWNKWAREITAGLTLLVHKVLQARISTHVLLVDTEYLAGTDPAFKVVNWEVLALAELLPRHDDIHGLVTQHMADASHHWKQQGARVCGYAIVRCNRTGRVIPCVNDNGPASAWTLRPEQIVAAINSGLRF